MADNTTVETAKVYSEEGSLLLALSGLRVDGDDIYIDGQLMGSFNTRMIMKPEDLVRAIQIVLNQMPELLGYVAKLPSTLKSHKAGA